MQDPDAFMNAQRRVTPFRSRLNLHWKWVSIGLHCRRSPHSTSKHNAENSFKALEKCTGFKTRVARFDGDAQFREKEIQTGHPHEYWEYKDLLVQEDNHLLVQEENVLVQEGVFFSCKRAIAFLNKETIFASCKQEDFLLAQEDHLLYDKEMSSACVRRYVYNIQQKFRNV